jgi:hypothetical protein
MQSMLLHKLLILIAEGSLYTLLGSFAKSSPFDKVIALFEKNSPYVVLTIVVRQRGYG